MLKVFFGTYIFLSIPFLFLNNGWEITGRFMGFVGSPTVYAGIITTLYIIVSKDWRIKSLKFITCSLLIFGLVYISKTRLILIFILIYPILKHLFESKSWLTLKNVFLVFLVTIMAVYPLYGEVIRWFPSLVSIRYQDNRDASFGLRYFLYQKMTDEYSDGTFVEKAIGKGNEYSRNYVKNLFKKDLMPHNDFVRILNDWGAVGLLLFLILLFRISTNNKNSFYVSIVYMLLFYSNMIFNMFLISLVITLYFSEYNSPILKLENEVD